MPGCRWGDGSACRTDLGHLHARAGLPRRLMPMTAARFGVRAELGRRSSRRSRSDLLTGGTCWILRGAPIRGRCARRARVWQARVDEAQQVGPASDRRGTGRGPGAGETLGIQGILTERKALSVQAERLGRGTVLMVRRRSTVRFRKEARNRNPWSRA